MKILPVSLALLLVGAASALADSKPEWLVYHESAEPMDRMRPSKWKIEAQTTKSGAMTTDRWVSDYGSYSRDSKKILRCHVKLSNAEADPGNVVIEMYVVASPTNARGTDKRMVPIYAKKAVARNGYDYQFDGRGDYSNARYAALGFRDKFGIDIEGWIVRLVRDNKVIGIRASTPAMEEFGSGRDPRWAEFVALVKENEYWDY